MPVKEISCQMGALTDDGMTAVILSHTAENATLTINDVDYTVAMATKFGNDRNVEGAGPDLAGDTHVCYIGVQEIAGLEPLTKYAWSVVQAGKTDSGFQYTSTTSKKSKVAVALGTCFNLTSFKPVNGWTFLRNYIDDPANPPLLSVLHVDDICYSDGAFNGLSGAASNSQGKQLTGGIYLIGVSATYTQYDHCAHYASWFGILEPFYNDGDDTPRLTEGLGEDMQYVRSRVAFMPSAGDHEYQNNLGWTEPMNTYPNAYHHTGLNSGTGVAVTDGEYDGRGLLSYNACMQHLQGQSAQVSDTVSKHWYADFGSFRYIAMDGTTQAVDDGSAVYGAGQISDVLSLVDGSQWWHGFGVPASGFRPNWQTEQPFPAYLAYARSEYGIGVQVKYKTEVFNQAEHDRMWLNSGETPKSLMDNPFANGNMGGALSFRGDWHQPLWCRFAAPATEGKRAENIHDIGLQAFGSTAYGGNFFQGGEQRDAKFLEDNVEFIGALSNKESTPIQADKPTPITVTIVEIDGEKQTPELTVVQWSIDTLAGGESEIEHFANRDGRTLTDHRGNVWRVIAERKFTRHGGLDGYKPDETPYQIPTGQTTWSVTDA